jgi:hypothetical protein
MTDLVGQVGNLRRVGNPPSGVQESQRRLPTGAQDTILPYRQKSK